MKRRKTNSLLSGLIDLTPLLDVVFIVLIVVLCTQDTISAQQPQTSAAVEASDYQELAEENAALSNQLSIYEELHDYVNVITVSAGFNSDNRKYRKIYLEMNGEQFTYELNPSNESTVWENCRKQLAEIADRNTSVPTLIAIKDESMLYRDVVAISEICSELSGDRNIFLRNYLESDYE